MDSAIDAAIGIRMTPELFASRCRDIVTRLDGHGAHRALDWLTNDVLRALGYGEGIAIFEAAVGHWHAEAHAYPHVGPCPDCEAAAATRAAA
jgi:hypothetical protein